jgi:hypothetical protein
VGWAGFVARRGREEMHARFWCVDLKERDPLEDPDVDGNVILKLIFEKWDGGLG